MCTQGSYCAGNGNSAVSGPCDPGYYCPPGMNVSNPADYTCPQGTSLSTLQTDPFEHLSLLFI